MITHAYMGIWLSYLNIIIFHVFFFFLSAVAPSVNGGDCRLSTINGGCPDKEQCRLTCSGCYRGVGTIVSYCETGAGGLPYTQCFCVMTKGANCNPGPGPKCPNWPRPPPSSLTGNNTTV